MTTRAEMFDSVDFDPEAFDLVGASSGEHRLASVDATLELGEALAEHVEPGDFVGLIGQLGSGKTTLVRGMVEQLGGADVVRSPTYTLVNRYDTEPPLVHADLYRLESVDDLETTGYWDYVRRGEAVLCIEWLDRVPQAWPGRGIVVELEHREQGRAARLWATDSHRGSVNRILTALGGRHGADESG